MSAAERAEMEAVNELQIAQLLEQRGALLEACKDMLEEMVVWEDSAGIHPAATKARAAIALAEGKEAV